MIKKLLIFSMIVFVFAVCAKRSASEDTGILSTNSHFASPEETFMKMREMEKQKDWGAFLSYFTERGKGWLIAELATALLWDGYAQPIDANRGKVSRDILAKYNLADLKFTFQNPNESIDDACIRLYRRLGCKTTEFISDFCSAGGTLFADYVIKTISVKENTATLIAVDGSTLQFLRMKNGWFCNGSIKESE